jgi:hypothetical protein
MAKVLIGAVVAAAIAFIWQAMSWMALGVHDNTLKYSAQQDAILAAISQNLTDDGVYAIPNVPPGTSQQAQQEFMDSMKGKPSSVVYFWKSTEMNMGRQMAMGFVLNLVAALIAAYVMSKVGGTFGLRLMVGLGFAVFMVFQSSLMMANWWNTPMHYLSGEIIDHLVGWGLGSAFLAWWLGRKPTT